MPPAEWTVRVRERGESAALVGTQARFHHGLWVLPRPLTCQRLAANPTSRKDHSHHSG